VDGISFLASAQVGDRVRMTAQVCRCPLPQAFISLCCTPTPAQVIRRLC
jgi:hypothetical protein